jgi:hypothetical protein
MAGTWLTVFTVDIPNPAGSSSAMVKQYAAWNIAPELFGEFEALYHEAKNALDLAQKKETRTQAANARCGDSFDALVNFMRLIKRKFLKTPPLTNADLVSLLLKVPGKEPSSEVMVETFLLGQRQLGIRFVYISGSPDDPANKSYRLWYKVVAPGETAPQSPKDLPKSFSTKRRKDSMDFEFNDSGKTAYFCVQIENGKHKGPWGAMSSALIP